MKYKVLIDNEAISDIQSAAEWYNHQLPNLGERFKDQVKQQINSLKNKPTVFAIRYDNVRCMIVKKFPFMIHFVVDKKSSTVIVYALFHTSRNPDVWKRK